MKIRLVIIAIVIIAFGLMLRQALDPSVERFIQQMPHKPIAQSAIPGFRVITYATDPHHPLLQLLLKTSPYPITVLGQHQPWRAFRDKFEGVYSYLIQEHLEHSKDLILFIDGYDTLFTPFKQNIIQKFKLFKTPIVTGAHLYCGRRNFCITNPIQSLNSGTYMGYASSIYEMLKEILEQYPKEDSDDQGLMQYFFAEHPDQIALDDQQTLFSVLQGTMSTDYHYEPQIQQFYNQLTQSNPVILHGNNGPGLLLYLYNHMTQDRGWLANAFFYTPPWIELVLVRGSFWFTKKLYYYFSVNNKIGYFPQLSHFVWRLQRQKDLLEGVVYGAERPHPQGSNANCRCPRAPDFRKNTKM